MWAPQQGKAVQSGRPNAQFARESTPLASIKKLRLDPIASVCFSRFRHIYSRVIEVSFVCFDSKV